jgi:NADH dehydrogenase, FAD-containing subunit
VANFAPASVSKETQRVLVKPNLQLQDARFPNIFSLGDVAETYGPKMARAGYFQAEVVSTNILKMIRGNTPNKLYRPMVDVEGAIKLSLGKVSCL